MKAGEHDELIDVIVGHRPQWGADDACTGLACTCGVCGEGWPCLAYRLATRTLVAEVRLDARAGTPAYLTDYEGLVDQLCDGLYDDDDDGRGSE